MKEIINFFRKQMETMNSMMQQKEADIELEKADKIELG